MRKWPAAIPEADREWYLQRGSAIHLATALHDRGTLDRRSVDERIIPFVDAWINFRNQVGGTITDIERRVSNTRYGYLGTLDRIIMRPSVFRGGRLLVDIKTNEADVVTRLQTAGYRMALKKGKLPIARAGVSLKNNGTFRCEVYDNDPADDAAWLACLQVSRWKWQHNQQTEGET